jgi:CheY-like chemotaxis protein
MIAAEHRVDLRRVPPAPLAASHPVPRLPPSADGHRPCHVLVLDDESTIVEILHLHEVLADDGCKVTSFRTLPPLDEVAHLTPDAIILDLVFGGQATGVGFLVALRADPATAAIPVVICTALTGERVVSALPEPQLAVPVLTKPFDLDAIVGVVRDAIRAGVVERSS